MEILNNFFVCFEMCMIFNVSLSTLKKNIQKAKKKKFPRNAIQFNQYIHFDMSDGMKREKLNERKKNQESKEELNKKLKKYNNSNNMTSQGLNAKKEPKKKKKNKFT